MKPHGIRRAAGDGVLARACHAQTFKNEEQAIIAVITKAYIGGVYNDPDAAAMKDAFMTP